MPLTTKTSSDLDARNYTGPRDRRGMTQAIRDRMATRAATPEKGWFGARGVPPNTEWCYFRTAAERPADMTRIREEMWSKDPDEAVALALLRDFDGTAVTRTR